MKALGVFSFLLFLAHGVCAQTASKTVPEPNSWWFNQMFHSFLKINEKTQACEPPPKLKVLSASTKMSAYTPVNTSMEGGKYDAYYNKDYLQNQQPSRKKSPAKWRAWKAKVDAYRAQHRLRTLQDFLAGKADYVSVAIDNRGAMRAFKGKYLCIPSLDQSFQKEIAQWGKAHPAEYRKFGGHIPFKIVDTGGAFFDQKFSKIDICVGDPKHRTDADDLMHDPRLQKKTVLQDCDPLFRPSLSAND